MFRLVFLVCLIGHAFGGFLWYPQEGNNNIKNEMTMNWGKVGDVQILEYPTMSKRNYNNQERGFPNTREVSNVLASSLKGLSPKSSRNHTEMMSAWGLFISNDMFYTRQSYDELPIYVPKCDDFFDSHCEGNKTLSFWRSEITKSGFRINDVTAFIDASTIYGSSFDVTNALRSHRDGKLLVSNLVEGEFPPLLSEVHEDYLKYFSMPSVMKNTKMFACGDSRCNENPLVLSLHVLFLREHNRIASLIKQNNPDWNDNNIFSAARRYIIAEIQHITLNEYLYWLIGREFPANIEYNDEIDPRIHLFFSTVAARSVHSTLGDSADFDPSILMAKGATSVWLRLANEIQFEVDPIFSDSIRNEYMAFSRSSQTDLFSLDLQRSRDHGIPLCNDVRVAYGLPEWRSWDDFRFPENKIGDLIKLRITSLYDSPARTDAFVCALAEKLVDSSSLGSLFESSIIDQFKRTIAGDRFWYSRNLDKIHIPEIEDVRSRSLKKILQDNSNEKVEFPSNVFSIDTSYDVSRVDRIKQAKIVPNIAIGFDATAPAATTAQNWVPTTSLPGGAACLIANGFPSSPKTIIPFVSAWLTPPFSDPKPVSTAFPFSIDMQGRKLEYHEIEIVNQNIQIFFPGNPTPWIAYKLPAAASGTVPGPTIRACKGVQTLVRFKNLIEGPDNRYVAISAQHPYVGNRGPGPDICSAGFINPWPIQVHLHGSGSLAPYDGWADDISFSGCGKDYYYPNNRPATMWYHDHAIHETANNAYHGLAGEYWVEDCCSEIVDILPSGPYHLPLILRDAVFDGQDRLLFDLLGVHKNHLYGDHILVNGVPWPVLHVERRQYRFGFLTASVSRPFFLQFSDQVGSYFLVIGSDGGYRQTVVRTEKLRIAVAERYDVIIDFAQPAFAGLTEIILHNLDLYDVPRFCQTNLVMKFIIDLPTVPTVFPPLPAFTTNVFTPIPPLPAPLPPSTPSPFTFPIDPLRPVIEGMNLLFFPQFSVNPPAVIPLVPNHPLAPPLVPDAFLAVAEDPLIPPRRQLQFRQAGGVWEIRTIDIVGGAAVVVGGASQTWDSTYNTDNGTPLPVAAQWTTRTGLQEHVTADPSQNTLEVWEIVNGGGGWFHPIHIHLIDFFLTNRKGGQAAVTLATQIDGLADYERHAAKDVVFLGPGEVLRVVSRYGPHGGNYMMHCHNLIHEDNDMMVAFRVIPGRALVFNPTDPTFQGLDLISEPQPPLDQPLAITERSKPIALLPPITVNYLARFLNLNTYRLIYPPEQFIQGYPVNWKAAPYFSRSLFVSPFVNPWEVPYIELDRPTICPTFAALHVPAPGALSFYATVAPAAPIGSVTGILSIDPALANNFSQPIPITTDSGQSQVQVLKS